MFYRIEKQRMELREILKRSASGPTYFDSLASM